jgi:hypothetical protein
VKRLILAVTLLGAIPGAWARDAGGSYATVEARSCDALLQDKKARGFEYNADTTWVAGYLTAYNALTPDTADILGGTDLSGAMLRLQRYCEAHPADSLAQAMLALTAELYPGRRTR